MAEQQQKASVDWKHADTIKKGSVSVSINKAMFKTKDPKRTRAGYSVSISVDRGGEFPSKHLRERDIEDALNALNEARYWIDADKGTRHDG